MSRTRGPVDLLCPRAILVLVAALAVFLGCASSKDEPLLLPPVTVTNSGPSPEGQLPAADAADSAPRAKRDEMARADPGPDESGEEEADPSLVVLGGSDLEAAPETNREMLLQASRRAKERRESGEQVVLVLTDENLAEQAEGGRVTLGLENPPELADTSGAASEMAEKEAYWRDRVLDIRRRWREAHDSLDPLEAEAAKLRTRFYSEDDPVRRDREIKPQWDRTLDRLAEARDTLDSARAELRIAYEEGRMDGALPGWLRTGSELGPFDLDEPAEGEQLDELNASEPTTVEPQSLEPPM